MKKKIFAIMDILFFLRIALVYNDSMTFNIEDCRMDIVYGEAYSDIMDCLFDTLEVLGCW